MRSGLSHDLGPRKLWKETDPNFLPLELKQNLKARGYQHRQRWRLGGGGSPRCVSARFPGSGSVPFLVDELVTQPGKLVARSQAAFMQTRCPVSC